jgi:uncharacterized protein
MRQLYNNTDFNTPMLVIDVSARALACAAHKAGIPVYALDMFNDIDTQECVVASRQVKANRWEFDLDDLLTEAESLCPKNTPLTFGSGFESHPELLEELARGRRLYGNSPELIKKIKDPAYFFGLLKKLGIPHPPTALTKPQSSTTPWLVKTIGGTGGYHIQPLDSETEYPSNVYFQAELHGTPHSILFLANGHDSQVIGYSEFFDNRELLPLEDYCYHGAVSVFNMPFQAQLEEAIQAIVAETGLCGLCAMDIMLNANGFHVLEINPRPSASFELHQIKGNLFYWHLQACIGNLPHDLPHPRWSRAHAVVYAPYEICIPDNVLWQAWTADHPPAGTLVTQGKTVCSVFAQGVHGEQLVKQRQRTIEMQLNQWARN